jgi:hypothetical protein
MKDNETEYLNKLFASASDATDDADEEVPLIDVPKSLSNKLYAIAEPTQVGTGAVKQGFFASWPTLTSIAAGLLVAVMGFQFYQQQQTLKQLERAQADLATALHYLGEANRITRSQVLNSVNENMKRAGVKPAVEIGRDAISPAINMREPENKTPNRTL